MLPFLSVLYFLCDNFIFTRWRFIQPQIIRCCLGCSGMKVGGWKLQTRPSFDQSSLEEISRFLVKTCLYGRCFLLKQAVPFVTGFCAFQTDGTLMEFCDFFAWMICHQFGKDILPVLINYPGCKINYCSLQCHEGILINDNIGWEKLWIDVLPFEALYLGLQNWMETVLWSEMSWRKWYP